MVREMIVRVFYVVDIWDLNVFVCIYLNWDKLKGKFILLDL